jgi:hypothetical protein
VALDGPPKVDELYATAQQLFGQQVAHALRSRPGNAIHVHARYRLARRTGASILASGRAATHGVVEDPDAI